MLNKNKLVLPPGQALDPSSSAASRGGTYLPAGGLTILMLSLARKLKLVLISLASLNNKKIISSLLIVALLFLAAPKPTRADFWGSSQAAAIWTFEANKMLTQIENTIVAALKTAGIKLIMTQLNKMLGIGQTGPIGNWQQFIYSSANQYAMMITNSFFQSLSAGGTAYTNQYIIGPAMRAAMSTSVQGPNIQNYVREGRSDLIFQPGYAQNPKVAWQVAAQSQNDPGYLYLQGLSKEINAYNQQVGAKTAEGIAGAGFQSKRSGGSIANPDSGTITMPGASQKDLASKVNSMPMDRLDMAQTIPDVVVGIATGVLTQLLNEGIGMMGQAANKASGGALGSVIAPLGGAAASIGGTVIRSEGASVQSSMQNAIQQGLK